MAMKAKMVVVALALMVTSSFSEEATFRVKRDKAHLQVSTRILFSHLIAPCPLRPSASHCADLIAACRSAGPLHTIAQLSHTNNWRKGKRKWRCHFHFLLKMNHPHLGSFLFFVFPQKCRRDASGFCCCSLKVVAVMPVSYNSLRALRPG